jgi:hypothetical protein
VSTIERTYQIAGDLRASFVYDSRFGPERALSVIWEPAPPGELRGKARQRYNTARAHFATILAERLGKRLILLDTLGVPEPLVNTLRLAMAEPGGHA